MNTVKISTKYDAFKKIFIITNNTMVKPNNMYDLSFVNLGNIKVSATINKSRKSKIALNIRVKYSIQYTSFSPLIF